MLDNKAFYNSEPGNLKIKLLPNLLIAIMKFEETNEPERKVKEVISVL
jgi:hypothetical protein